MIYGINGGFRIIAKDTQKTFASFNRPTIQAEITIAFDSQGRRTEYKSVTNGAQNTWLRFLYDGYLCVQVLYSNEPYNVFKEFVWDPTEPVATRPLVFRYAPNSLNLFYAFDGNKNVSDVFYRMTSNGIGAHYDYAPFGGTTRTHSDSSASFDIVALNPFRFSSEYYDSELDLVYYNFRHYSPSLGRFLSRDPIEEQGGWNLYAFVGNHVLIAIDSLGKELLVYGELEYRPKKKTVFGSQESNGEVSLLEWSFYSGKAVRSSKTCCYYLKNPLLEILLVGFYNDDEARKHEQYHFDVWVNYAKAFDLVISALLFRNTSCLEDYGKALSHWYKLQAWQENCRVDMIAHQNDSMGSEYREAYYKTQKALMVQKKLLKEKAKGCLCE